MKKLLIPCFFVLAFQLDAQLPYTQNQFSFSVESDIVYGVSENYVGLNDTLKMDIYKPIGDDNCRRPCLVLVHGGSWIGGSKADVNIVNIAEDFAQKGWVVAAVNYRLGTHKTSNYTMYAICNNSVSAPCGYITDSAEVFRANYRGQQDVKGAIRYMKERSLIDSTDIFNVFLAGESAGAFVAYAAAFMDDPSEKPTFCNAIADAPNPDSDLTHCLPQNYTLTRPDLGAVEGSLHLGNYDASVQGVGSFYGGIMDLDILSNTINWPVMYLFHQGSDVVVHYDYGRLLGRIDWECFAPLNICQPYAKYPKAYGSKGIDNFLNGLPNPPTRTVEIIENYEYQNDCFDNGHSIDNWMLRSQNMADLFATRLASNGNVPGNTPCNLTISESTLEQVRLYPIPSQGSITIENTTDETLQIRVYGMEGTRIISTRCQSECTLQLNSGMYWVEIRDSNGQRRIERISVI